MDMRVFLLLLLSSLHSTSGTILTGYETDRLSLIAFKNQVTRDPYGVLLPWNYNTSVCNWTGISCNNNQRITTIDLTYKSLSGFVSPSIANLTFLANLTLSNNGFYGEIPSEFGNLHHLRLLDLSYNSFHGSFPRNLTFCSDLTTLHLDSNSLSGTIPVELGSLSKLGILTLSNNSLTGKIPDSIGNLSSLSYVDLSYNQLQGGIPRELPRKLQVFQVGVNELSGTIPSSLFNLSSLYFFGVAGNQLEGSLPTTMGTTLPNLRKIDFGGNHFKGPLPPSLTNASGISFVEMSINNFSGNVPSGLGRLASLYYLNLESNQLENDDSWAFLVSLANCSQLSMMSLYDNNLSGKLPGSLANLSTHLQELRLNDNRISGIIPSGIGNLINLTILALGPNPITGSIPESIGMLKELQLLTFIQCRLVESIPSSFGNLTRLVYLYLNGNNLEGDLPSSFANLQNLEQLGLSGNRFTGTIPRGIFNLPSLSACGLSYNSFVGPLPSEVSNSQYLTGLYVAGNKLSGEIPASLGDCQLLQILDLQQNLFRGGIPSTFGKLKGLQSLDVSENNLSGPLPNFLQNLDLVYLNLSFNHFQGEVPENGIFRNATATVLLGNSGLCGGIPAFRLPVCLTNSSKRRRISLVSKLLVAIGSVVALCILLLSVTCIIWKMKSGKSTSHEETTTSLDDQYYPRVSYSDLAKATDGFSSANLIGTGSYGTVYKGVTDDGTEIAVKVFDLRNEGASRSFVNECEALRSIRHRNLIKILTSCSSVDSEGNDFKALVFKLMPNGNLESWLHSNGENLDLIRRLDIAIDVAAALEYLHCGCEMPLVHCDLKPSNILLDGDMVAHVGDFGLARLVLEVSSSSSIGMRGTIGYIAPEYGSGGEVSTSGDVYSYGILVLEIFTGMKPVSDKFKDGLSLRDFIEESLTNRVVAEIIDPLLMLYQDNIKIGGISTSNIQECLASVLRLGLSCSKLLPRERPEMRDVATELHTIRDTLLRAA